MPSVLCHINVSVSPPCLRVVGAAAVWSYHVHLHLASLLHVLEGENLLPLKASISKLDTPCLYIRHFSFACLRPIASWEWNRPNTPTSFQRGLKRRHHMYADLETAYGNLCPSWALSVGYCGVASAAVLSNWGSAVSYVCM